MKEILNGVVMELDGDFAKVKPQRHSQCDDCQACNAQELTVLAFNPVKAEVGSRVQYTEAQSGILRVAWVLFAQPLLAVFLGAFLGSQAADFIKMNPTAGGVIGGVVFFGLAILFAFFFDKRYKLNHSNFAKIIEIES